MIKKNYLKKASLLLVTIFSVVLFMPSTVRASLVPIQMEHQIKVPVNKVWKIKFNKPIIEDKLLSSVKVYSPLGELVVNKVSYDSLSNTIIVEPPAALYKEGQTYSLQICETITDLDSNPLKSAVIKNFTIAVTPKAPLVNTTNRQYVYKQYDNTLAQMEDVQSGQNPPNKVANYDLDASTIDISEYLKPGNFVNHNYAVYQFLKLNYIEGITAGDLNVELGGILAGKGETFLKFCRLYDVNPAYIVAHTILETGNGTSALANGIDVSEVAGLPVDLKTTYNLFGIGAYDQDPDKCGSEKAYNMGWFSVDAAIEGGIKWISDAYINNATYKQNTIYKMRWNPTIPADGTYRHQYATDISWSYKQSFVIKEILDKYRNAQLVFEIPQYK